jgi:hypothetical protein
VNFIDLHRIIYDEIKHKVLEPEVCMSEQSSCEFCNNLIYDEECEEYICDVDMDEDDYAHFLTSHYKECPYYQSNDEYKIVRHQM